MPSALPGNRAGCDGRLTIPGPMTTSARPHTRRPTSRLFLVPPAPQMPRLSGRPLERFARACGTTCPKAPHNERNMLGGHGLWWLLCKQVGFEPTRRFRAYRFSRPSPGDDAVGAEIAENQTSGVAAASARDWAAPRPVCRNETRPALCSNNRNVLMTSYEQGLSCSPVSDAKRRALQSPSTRFNAPHW